MRSAARIVVAMAVAAFAVPVLACGFEKSPTTTMSAPAPAATAARSDKAKPSKASKAERVKATAPPAQKLATSR